MVRLTSQEVEFRPSERLIKMFAEGAREHFVRLKESEKNLSELAASSVEDLNLKPTHIRRIIAEQTIGVLYSYGRRKQAGLFKEDVIAGETFPKAIQEELLQLLPVEEKRGPDFCKQLLTEVKTYLRTGGALVASWGRVKLTDKDEVAVIVDKVLPDLPPLSERFRLTTKGIDL